MAVFRVNLFSNFENAMQRRAFSAPSKTNSVFLDYNDISKWSELEKIKKGNLLLLCRNIDYIWAVGFASQDCHITDVDSFREDMTYELQGNRYVNFEVYRELHTPVDGRIFFEGLLQNRPFEDYFLCIKLEPEKKLKNEFENAINFLLESIA